MSRGLGSGGVEERQMRDIFPTRYRRTRGWVKWIRATGARDKPQKVDSQHL